MRAKLLQTTHSLWTCLARNAVGNGDNGSRDVGPVDEGAGGRLQV